MDTRQQVKIKLASGGVPLAAVTRRTGLDYGRVQRILGGYAQPAPGEVEALLAAIDQVVAFDSRRDVARETAKA